MSLVLFRDEYQEAEPPRHGIDFAALPATMFLETCEGRDFCLNAPVFKPTEMAAALSKICRFAGHSLRFYSVAEHSILVARIMHTLDLGDPFEGLMHDGTESVLADIAAPLKALLPDYKRLERALESVMREQFELPLHTTEGCKRADWIAVALEAEELMPSKGAHWALPDGVREQVATFRRLWQAKTGDRVRVGVMPYDLGERAWLREFDRMRAM